MKITHLYELLKTATSSKRNFKNFILAYVVLRFEFIRNIFIQYKKLTLKRIIVLDQSLDITKEKELKACGYVILNALSNDKIYSIKNQLASLECYDYYQPSLGKFSPSSPPPEANIGGYSPTQLCSIKEIMEIANDPKTLAIAQDYFGCKPTISRIAAWWSFPGVKAARTNQLFHRDFDDIKFLKLFVYLTEVDLTSGPHVYVEKTADMQSLRRPTRFSDDIMEKMLPNNNRMSICGPAGYTFIADTFGWHKGELPIDRPRLLLQIQYSINPVIDETYNTQQFPDYEKYDSYINRLFLKNYE